ncbi:helix-turn-helix domain-containing protein [Streptomyces clavuligerus]|nr:helix-turn-helix domain-containing protein [Streptomyces clavuligerus]ANW22245.1 AraC family transcriptional regulator [Streptomyces clavuligerus]EDY47695.1 AraC-family transcriptional regulator [Streptomyces clavuligerus]WDN56921.1 helix-turn-helix domain-containing protein [Streptomyces clavuligerus]
MTTAPPRQPRPVPSLPMVHFDSMDIPASDRFAYWCDLMGSTHAPLDLLSDHADDFRARQQVFGLGDVVVWPATFPSVIMRRSTKLIRQSDPESYHLSLLLNGHGVVTRQDWEADYGPGHFHSQNTSQPVDIQGSSELGRIQIIGLEVPKELLPLPKRLADRAIGLPMSERHGVGALLGQFLRQVARNAGDYRLADGPRLGGVAADLVATMFAHALDQENALPPHTHRYTTVLRIKAFIERNLGDPELTPTAVAAAHNISTGHLHRIFREEGITVAALIRRSRLERARAELVDPLRAGERVHTVAARWGLTAAEFSRSFRATYGMSPSDYRQLHRRTGPGDR